MPSKTGHAAGVQHPGAMPGAERAEGPHGSVGTERRRKLMERLRARKGGPIAGSELARQFHVSRQCLVQDVAILRARGEEIVSTPRGYRLPDAQPAAHRAIIACKHGPERTQEELNILVDHGVKIIDVVVEHALYGELRGSLAMESRTDVSDFIKRWRRAGATLLSALTGGVHLHTIEASRPEMITRAKAQLLQRGILLK